VFSNRMQFLDHHSTAPAGTRARAAIAKAEGEKT
jgi:hypothetical protein